MVNELLQQSIQLAGVIFEVSYLDMHIDYEYRRFYNISTRYNNLSVNDWPMFECVKMFIKIPDQYTFEIQLD